MARFRLRFLLQELDLVGPTVTLGRSSDCQITLDDPLVSRVHAELTITADAAHVRDLGSRNGVRVNDVLVTQSAKLEHKDRLRLGTQDLVFLVVSGRERIHNATGALVHCKECDRAFPGQALVCPRCGARSPFQDDKGPDTVTGIDLAEGPSWTFRLIAEVLERALNGGRIPEAEKMLERAARDLDARVQAGKKLGIEQLRDAAHYALRLAKLKRRAEWARWAVSLHHNEHRAPAHETLLLLEQLDEESLRALRPELAALIADPALAHNDGDSATRIAQLLRRAG